MTTPLEKERLVAVDVCRVLAAFAVICIHTEPFAPNRVASDSPLLNFLHEVISLVCRFAVPFFFCTSGYFWGRKIRGGAPLWPTTRTMLSRLTAIFAFWFVAYFLPIDFAAIGSFGPSGLLKSYYWHFLKVVKHPVTILYGGDAVHLWFLPALLCALTIAYFFVSKKRSGLLLGTALLLYVIGVLGGAYQGSEVGFSLHIGNNILNTRDGPFFGTLFFTTGYLLSARNPKRSWAALGLIILTAGLVIHFSEFVLIQTCLHSKPVPVSSRDFAFGTYGMGVGAFLMAIANPRWLGSPLLARWGKVTLGIYCVHYYFVKQLTPVVEWLHNPVSELLFPVVVFLLSLLAVWILMKNSFTQRFVQ